MPLRQGADAPEEVLAVDLSRGVAGGIEQQTHSAGRDGFFQGFQRGEVGRRGRFHHHRISLEESDLLQITHPGGSGNQDLISGIHQTPQGLVEQGLRSGAHQNLFGGIGEAEPLLIVRRDGFFEFGNARTGGVVGFSLDHGFPGRLQGAGRRGEVRFSRAEGNDVLSLGRQSLGLSRHRQSGGGFHAKRAMG